MKTPIEKLYCLKENFEAVPQTEEVKALKKEERNAYAEFVDSLTAEQKQKFEKYEALDNIFRAEEERQNFKKGFKLGLAIAAESLIK